MALDLLTFGEALVEIMRAQVGETLYQPGMFIGPYPSGAPFIFAMQAARLGAKVAAIGTVGADPFGRCLIEGLQQDNIEIQGLRVSLEETTGVAFVAYNHDGSREFIYHIEHSAAGDLYPDMLEPPMFEGLRVLHLMGSSLSIHEKALQTGLRALELAQANGAKISFDPNLRPQLLAVERARELFAPVVQAADVIMPTAEELCLLVGVNTVQDAAIHLLQQRPDRLILVTQGAQGCRLFSSATPEGMQIPGFAVEEVDPTGAGDCFDAGFLVRWIEGATIEDAARFACACGALAVTKQGPAAGAMPRDIVETFMRERGA